MDLPRLLLNNYRRIDYLIQKLKLVLLHMSRHILYWFDYLNSNFLDMLEYNIFQQDLRTKIEQRCFDLDMFLHTFEFDFA